MHQLTKGYQMNRDWKHLKMSKHGMPSWDSLIPYVLEVLKNGEEATRNTIEERLLTHLQIPEDMQKKTFPDKPDSATIFVTRMGFALSDLIKADALKRPKRGVYQITEDGLALLNRFGDQLSTEILKDLSAYQYYEQELEIRNQRKNASTNVKTIEFDVDEDLEDVKEINIDSIVNNRNNEVAMELLDRIHDNSPYFFESLVVKLLVKMGYSGENGEAKVTSRSNDGGIDGIINQDPLGTSTVYLQAKRYKEGNVVGTPAIQSFYGAIANVRAQRGVFISTSSFSKGAIEYAKRQGIVLIDGIQLTDLMLRYEVGVEKAKEYVVYRVDNDFFEMDEI